MFNMSASNMVTLMDEEGISMALVMPPPAPADSTEGAHYPYTALIEAVNSQPGRFGVVGGGNNLNEPLHAMALQGDMPSEADLDALGKEARKIADDTQVAGFGELVALHLSYKKSHPYIEIAADHPGFLRLADVASEVGLPLDIHFELVAEKMTTPAGFKSPPEGNNPAELLPNIGAFEKLLAHNRNAKIVWSHVGWDNTGHMTVERLRTLIEKHSNLYLSLKLLDEAGPLQVNENRPLTEDGKIRSEWLTLMTDHPSRFVFGSDEFVGSDPTATTGGPSTAGTWSVLGQLPDAVARAVACDNPRAIYRLAE